MLPKLSSHSYFQAFDMSLLFSVKVALLSRKVRSNKFTIQIFFLQQVMRTR
ncbi:hypothetical protein L208DRAFT_1499453 [Tricholoma matsutake]|nr:hypothetical protein L208DRAFT_1499453 [Tricholoma matsutake 945]